MSGVDINDFIGLPWLANGRSVKGYDCWGLVSDVLKQVKGIDLPDWYIDPYSERSAIRGLTSGVAETLGEGKAERIYEASDFDIAILARKKTCFHVGLFYNGGVLHTRGPESLSTWERVEVFSRYYGGELRMYRWVI